MTNFLTQYSSVKIMNKADNLCLDVAMQRLYTPEIPFKRKHRRCNITLILLALYASKLPRYGEVYSLSKPLECLLHKRFKGFVKILATILHFFSLSRTFSKPNRQLFWLPFGKINFTKKQRFRPALR